MTEIQSAGSVLVLDPDVESAAAVTRLLGAERMKVAVCATGREGLSRLESEPWHVVVTELALPDMSGLDLLSQIGRNWPGLPVVMLAAQASVPDAVAALKAGAADFLQKPLDPLEVRFVLEKALTAVRMRADQPPPPSSGERAGLLGQSAAMRQVYATLDRAAQGTSTVLVRGESGTGKELIARAIHEASPRSAEPFVKIDCASLPEQLLESELFGYERGAFTGAVARKPGRIELADKGTLFLDEIGELGIGLQAKLLRLLQDRQIERLGGTKTIKVDVRVVAATHRDLDGMVESGQFRQDLFYRLNVVPLWLPPLRARREDIEPLARHFCKLCGAANGKPDARLDDDVVRVLRAQKWPGNVRQLQNFIERLVVLSPDSLVREPDVRAELSRQVRFTTQPGTGMELRPLPEVTAAAAPEASAADAAGGPSSVIPLDIAVRSAERKALEHALRITKHNRSLAARLLGVSRSTLYAKLREHGFL